MCSVLALTSDSWIPSLDYWGSGQIIFYSYSTHPTYTFPYHAVLASLALC